jgi:hypothetical protein
MRACPFVIASLETAITFLSIMIIKFYEFLQWRYEIHAR